MNTTTVSEEDEKTLNGADEGNEIINPQKDCPVAYYGHVPHTPANDGVHFKWEEKVWNFCGIIFLKFMSATLFTFGQRNTAFKCLSRITF